MYDVLASRTRNPLSPGSGMQKQTSAMNVMGLSSGYADCLRRLRRACEAGEQMDCSCLGEGTKLLLAQSEATLEAQLSFYAEMHASLCCLGVEKARGNGKKAGRPRQAVPEIFAEVLADWNKGLVSNKQAAALCGISQKVFLGRAFEENRKICEADQVSNNYFVVFSKRDSAAANRAAFLIL